MVIHVGIHPYSGKVLSYDHDTKETNEFSITQRGGSQTTKSIKLMYDEILSYIDGKKLGCVCLCLDECYNVKERNKCKQIGLKPGFEKVEIISRRTSNFIQEMFESNVRVKNGDIIWVLNKLECDIWKIKEKKAIFSEKVSPEVNLYIEEDHVERFMAHPKLEGNPPDVIFCSEHIENVNYNKLCYSNGFTNINFVKEMFPSTKFLTCHYENVEKGALIKAKIAAGIAEVLGFDGEHVLEMDLIFKLGNKRIFIFERGLALPISQTIKLGFVGNKKCLNVTSIPVNSKMERRVNIQNFAFGSIIVDIKTNSIFDVKYFREKLRHLLRIGPCRGIDNKLCSNFDPNCNGKSKIFYIPQRIKSNDENINVLGIDLGTTRCCAAVNRINGIETVALDNIGQRLLPSYVSYDEEKEKCGQIVIDRLRYHSKSTIFDAKRLIGKSLSEINFDRNWPFKILEASKIVLEVESFKGYILKTPIEVSADLLKYIKAKAEEFQGKQLSEVVITIPAGFSISQESATYVAAKLAGWEKVHLLPEPIAASFAYYINRPLFIKETLLLFDLGGGTLDVCILEIQNDIIQIMCREGDLDLGGRDFDNLLVKHFFKVFESDYGITNKKINKTKLMIECQRIKESLSTNIVDSLDIEDYDATKFGFISISRFEFESLALGPLSKIQHCITSTLSNIGYENEKIEKILHVGGGSRMPMIKNLLQQRFPDAEHCCLQHPDEAVAIGATYHAHDIFTPSVSLSPVIKNKKLQQRINI